MPIELSVGPQTPFGGMGVHPLESGQPTESHS